MTTFANAFGPHAPDDTYVAHKYDEQLPDAGEGEINYATARSRDSSPTPSA